MVKQRQLCEPKRHMDLHTLVVIPSPCVHAIGTSIWLLGVIPKVHPTYLLPKLGSSAEILIKRTKTQQEKSIIPLNLLSQQSAVSIL